jgi:hypothetical protein
MALIPGAFFHGETTMPLFLYSLTFWSGVAAGAAVVLFWNKITAWLARQEAGAAAAVQSEATKVAADIKSKL